MQAALLTPEQEQWQGAGNFVDLVQSADFNKYFDAIGGGTRDGRAQAQYVDFSTKSVKAAAREGRAFLALFPASDVRAARDALSLPA